MKKEYFLILALILLLLGSVLDFFAGPAKPALKNPFDFLKLTVLSVYPLTAVSVGAKALFMSIVVLLGLSLFEGLHLAKGLLILFLAALVELYAVQQLATSARITPLEWTLASAAAGIILILPAIFIILFGAAKNVHQKITQSVEPPETPS